MHHGPHINQQTYSAMMNGWAREWQAAGFYVVGWGWLEGDPVVEAEVAVGLCQTFDLDGYIANAENPYEDAGIWKSEPFVDHFTSQAPHAPLGLSYIGDGHPYRNLDFEPWVDTGAALLPQCYWSTFATSIDPSIDAVDRLGVPRDIVFPTLGTSGFQIPYPAEFYEAELDRLGQPYSVWLLESTTDDTLRALAA